MVRAAEEAAVGEGEGVVEVGGVGEIGRGELVEGVGAVLAADQDFNLKLLRVHGMRIALRAADEEDGEEFTTEATEIRGVNGEFGGMYPG
jgi:hypothetical protein